MSWADHLGAMRPADVNLNLAEAMVGELEAYLLSSEVFWPISRRPSPGDPPFPRLTIGGLLLVLDELDAEEPVMTPQMSSQVQKIRSRLDQLRGTWAVSLERKAGRELNSRLSLWQAYLSDLEETPRAAEDYPHEVRNRVMVSRLASISRSLPEAPQHLAHIRSLDARLRSNFRHGAFAWDERLRATYPQDDFWFLYGSLTPAST